jgi:UPF0716 family protein affecting phage T7 exclusion
LPFIFFLLFIVLPFVELSILLQIGGEIGALNTIALIVGTGIVGGYLAKREGLSVWRRFQAKLSQGGMPGDELIDGLIILVAGALLVTPGVITDIVGLLGLLPPSRKLLKSQIRKRFFIDTASGIAGGFRTTRAYYTNRREGLNETPESPSPNTSGKVDITDLVDRQTEKRPS